VFLKIPCHYQYWTSYYSIIFDTSKNTIAISAVRKENLTLLILEDKSAGKSLEIKLEKSFMDDDIYPRMKKALILKYTLPSDNIPMYLLGLF
jgi:hypothetical protein